MQSHTEKAVSAADGGFWLVYCSELPKRAREAEEQ